MASYYEEYYHLLQGCKGFNIFKPKDFKLKLFAVGSYKASFKMNKIMSGFQSPLVMSSNVMFYPISSLKLADSLFVMKD